jgi:hypothetical protein
MKNLLKQTVCIAFIGLALSSCDKDDKPQKPADDQGMEVTLAAGDSSTVIGKINQFRQDTGNPVNTTPNVTGGRREINWDGVPAELISPSLFPADFFNATAPAAPDGRKRGLVYVPANAALLVSEKNFTEIDPAYKGQFNAFSKAKVFSAKGTNITEIRFLLPGTNTAAYVNSFGLIFSDVDNAEASTVAIYEGDKLIGTAKAQAADKKFSFVGLHIRNAKITRVKITSGNTTLAAGVADGTAKDIVVMDDFIYSEPKAL